MPETTRDYVEWHRAYDDPTSALSRRLEVVRRRLGQALAAIPGEECRVLSLCAGDGRDILDVVGTFAAGSARITSVVLVELNPELASAAGERARGHGLEAAVVIRGDAGDTSTWKDFVPVDLLVLCGIFGNISPGDIEQTIGCVPAMVRDGGYVVWTRGAGPGSDLRPQVRSWFADAGLPELPWTKSASGPSSAGWSKRGPLLDRARSNRSAFMWRRTWLAATFGDPLAMRPGGEVDGRHRWGRPR